MMMRCTSRKSLDPTPIWAGRWRDTRLPARGCARASASLRVAHTSSRGAQRNGRLRPGTCSSANRGGNDLRGIRAIHRVPGTWGAPFSSAPESAEGPERRALGPQSVNERPATQHALPDPLRPAASARRISAGPVAPSLTTVRPVSATYRIGGLGEMINQLRATAAKPRGRRRARRGARAGPGRAGAVPARRGAPNYQKLWLRGAPTLLAPSDECQDLVRGVFDLVDRAPSPALSCSGPRRRGPPRPVLPSRLSPCWWVRRSS